jgi:dephospho-CoA kinase
MIKVGITGGIGSGKTIVCEVFKQLGVPVYEADIEAKKLYDTNESVRNKMVHLLGEEIYDGQHLNRKKLAGLIFNDRELLQEVNSIVHPEVADHFLMWCENHTQHHYVIQESAVLFESNAFKMLDVCITVSAPVQLRMKRIMQRPGMTQEIASGIMKNQMPDDIKIRQSHFVIENDDHHLVIPQILKIHDALMHRKD